MTFDFTSAITAIGSDVADNLTTNMPAILLLVAGVGTAVLIVKQVRKVFGR